MKFDTETAALTATYQLDLSVTAPTVVYQGDLWCKTKEGCTCNLTSEGQALELDSVSYNAKENGLLEIEVLDPSYQGKLMDLACGLVSSGEELTISTV